MPISPGHYYQKVRRPSPMRNTPPSAATISPLSTVSSWRPTTPWRPNRSIRRKPVGSRTTDARRPVSPISDIFEDEDAVAIRDAAAAGVPFLDLGRGGDVELSSAQSWGTPPRGRSRGSSGGGSLGAGSGGEDLGFDRHGYFGTFVGGAPQRAGEDAREEGEEEQEDGGLDADTRRGAGERSEATMETGWRPGYLRRRVVISFVAGFSALIVTVEVLLAVDRARGGFRDGGKGVSVLWGYIPTAILTVTAALWGRFEFQAKRFIPWILLASQSGRPSPRDASETLLLDYTNSSLTATLRTSIRKRHFLVLAPTLTSLLLLAEIVLSTGVFVRQDVSVETDGWPAIIRDRFVLDYGNTNPPFQAAPDRNPYAVMLGIATANLSYPAGYTPGLAYQTFESPRTEGDAAFRMAVETVSARPECEVGVVEVRDTGFDILDSLTVSSTMCGENIPVTLYPREDDDAGDGDLYQFIYEDLDRSGVCNTSTESLVLAGVFRVKPASGGGFEHVDSAAVVCSVPFYSGTSNVIFHPDDGYAVLQSTRNDELVKRSFLDPIHYGLGSNGTFEPIITGADDLIENLPPPFVLAAHLAPSGLMSMENFLDGEKLRDAMAAFFAHFGPLAAHYQLREDSADLSTATAITVEWRLRVVPGIAHTMAALFGAALLLALPLVFYVPRRGIAPRNPNSVAGTAVLLCNSEDILSKLRGVDTSNLEAIGRELQGSYYSVIEVGPGTRRFVVKRVPEEDSTVADTPSHSPEQTSKGYNPWVLRSVFRTASIVLTSAFAATLWGLISASNNNDGLGNVPGPYGAAILWTCVPAAVLVTLGVYLKSVDFQTRLLAPFYALYHTHGFAGGMTTTYTDELAPVTAYKAARDRGWAVVLAKGAAVAAALMPILVCRLFTAEEVVRTSNVEVRQVESFGAEVRDEALLPIVDLASNNVTYPWTHGHLVFPRFTVVAGDMEDATVEVRLPAVKTELTCTPLEPVDGDLSVVECEPLDAGWSVDCASGQGDGYFGHVATKCASTSTSETFPAFVYYLWGSCAEGVLAYRAVVSCDERVVGVEAETTLRGASLFVASAEEDPGTRRETNLSLPRENVYDFAAGTGTGDGRYDGFFALLSQSTALSNEAPVESITDAIRTQHALLRAQALTALRAPSSSTSPASREGTRTRRAGRVVQNPVPACLLATLLTLAVGFSAASMVTAPKRVLPCSPGSIGAVAGMLAEWGIRVVPEGAEWMGDGEIRRYLERG